MFLDASALVAILAKEPGYMEIVSRIGDAQSPLYTSPLARFEAATGFARQRSGKNKLPTPELVSECAELVDDLLREMGATDIHITSSIGHGALRAAAAYGKAVGHPADLNCGDCFAYACAKAYRVKLIYKGDDFALTDLG
jgi:ribonuclease VapC